MWQSTSTAHKQTPFSKACTCVAHLRCLQRSLGSVLPTPRSKETPPFCFLSVGPTAYPIQFREMGCGASWEEVGGSGYTATNVLVHSQVEEVLVIGAQQQQRNEMGGYSAVTRKYPIRQHQHMHMTLVLLFQRLADNRVVSVTVLREAAVEGSQACREAFCTPCILPHTKLRTNRCASRISAPFAGSCERKPPPIILERYRFLTPTFLT